MFVTGFEAYREGNDFKKASKLLKEALYILGGTDKREKRSKFQDTFKNRFWLFEQQWVYRTLNKLITYLEGNSKPTRRGKKYLALAVAAEILDTWESMNRETSFSYKDDEEFTYRDEQPATIFASFVSAVKLEIESLMQNDPFKEYKDLHGLRNAISDLKQEKIYFK